MPGSARSRRMAREQETPAVLIRVDLIVLEAYDGRVTSDIYSSV